jgi:hypothetical protein
MQELHITSVELCCLKEPYRCLTSSTTLELATCEDGLNDLIHTAVPSNLLDGFSALWALRMSLTPRKDTTQVKIVAAGPDRGTMMKWSLTTELAFEVVSQLITLLASIARSIAVSNTIISISAIILFIILRGWPQRRCHAC